MNTTGISQICLDVHGVLADFATAAVELFAGERADGILAHWPSGQFDIHPVLGISRQDFWRKIQKEGWKFWAEMAPYPWHEQLVAACQDTAPTILLSRPHTTANSISGTCTWIWKYGGRGFQDYMVGHPKSALAKPGAVLIDDCDVNCNSFIEAGGQAIVFPQRWNSNHAEAANPLAYTLLALSKLAGHHIPEAGQMVGAAEGGA